MGKADNFTLFSNLCFFGYYPLFHYSDCFMLLGSYNYSNFNRWCNMDLDSSHIVRHDQIFQVFHVRSVLLVVFEEEIHVLYLWYLRNVSSPKSVARILGTYEGNNSG